MFAAKIRQRLSLLLIGALLIAYVTPVRAEVVLHGVPGTLTGAITVNGDVGQARGNNLFHSFSVFNVLRAGTSASGQVVPAQESVTFTPPTSGGPITNVINRVTGGTSAFTLQKFSLIDGPLNSSIPGANFWFINPNGIMFGSNAVLPTTGSFHASTADYIKLADGNIFATTPSSSEVLTVAPPSAFGFLSANPAGIQVSSAPRILQVPVGGTLSLVGGTINVGTATAAQGFLLAPAGRLNVVSVASAGEATFNPAKINGPLSADSDPFQTREINVQNFAKLGDINIRGGASPGTSLVDAKEIFIRSGNLTVDNSFVMPGIIADLGLLATQPAVAPAAVANGGQVKIRAAGDVSITGNRLIFNIDSGIRARAGSASATATTLTAPRDVPDLSVEAGGTLRVSGISTVRSEKYTQATASPLSFGNVAITAGRVEVLGGGQIGASSSISKGGDLSVDAREIVLDGAGNVARFTGLTTQSDFHPAYSRIADPRLANGEGGTLSMNADTLTMKRGANITADSFAFGPAGDIIINVRDLFLSRDGAPTGSIATQSTLAGDAGNITIRADRIELNEGRISATTNGSGEGGLVDVVAGKSLTISGVNGGIISLTAPPPTADLNTFAQKLAPFFGVPTLNFAGLVAAIEGRGVDLPDNAGLFDVLRALNQPPFSITAVADVTPGNSGQISVTTPSLVMNAGTRLDSSTLWDGNAGQIAGNVGSLTLNDGAQIRSQSGGVVVATGQPSVGIGNGGSVTFTAADSILITGPNSAVSTNTLGNGNGGNVSLNASKSVSIVNGGLLSADSLGGAGLAGNVTITSGDQIIMNNGSVSTRAVTSDGGNISLNAPHMIQLTDSRITTSVESGVGGGGNINIDPEFLILNNSQILANAFGGPGGNINIVADVFLVNSGGTQPTSLAGIVEASSALSTPGTINIEATVTDVSGTVAPLPETPLQATELLRAACAARFAGGKASSMVLSGRDGLPLQPGGLLPSPPYLASDSNTPSTTDSSASFSAPMGLSLLGSSDRPSNRYSLLPNVNCS
jgi:filamentous hemagglutinin family protein